MHEGFQGSFPDSDERLLYGTDWSMIGQEERFPKLLPQLLSLDIMAPVPERWDMTTIRSIRSCSGTPHVFSGG